MIRFVWRGFAVEFTFFFAAAVTFCLLTDQSGISTLAFLACILHEGGHLLAFAAVGVKPRAMIFELCGIRLIPPAQKPPFHKELLIQSGGVLMNFLLAGLSGLAADQTAAAVHLLLACFSLLPLKTLDGGQLLRLLTERFLPPSFWRIPDLLDTVVSLLICLFCGILLFTGHHPLTLLVFSTGLLGSLSAGILLRAKKRISRHKHGKL